MPPFEARVYGVVAAALGLGLVLRLLQQRPRVAARPPRRARHPRRGRPRAARRR